MSEQNNTNVIVPVVQESAKMVAKYAKTLINDNRAKQFAAQMSVMAKKDPKLAQCEPDTIVASMIACVHLDLMPNTPEQLAFIIPYRNSKLNRMEAQFQVGYKGLVQLAYRSGTVASIGAELVFPTDVFEVDLGKRELHHKPDLKIDRTNYADAIAVYAIAKLNNNQIVFEVLSRSEIEKVKETVKAKSTGTPWKEWEEAMVKKTAIKRLAKTLQSNNKDNRLAYASAYDSWAEAGKLKMVDGQIVEDEVIVPERTPEEEAKIKQEAKEVAEKIKQAEEAENVEE